MNQQQRTTLTQALRSEGFTAVFNRMTYGPKAETSPRQSHLSRAWHAGMLGRQLGGLGVVGPVGRLPA